MSEMNYDGQLKPAPLSKLAPWPRTKVRAALSGDEKPKAGSCPHCYQGGTLREGLPPLTERLKALPIDAERGYPVPFFVAWVNGKPEFQMADSDKKRLCIVQKLCWVCGQRLTGTRKAFVIGPMCSINRVSSEPPSHLDCAQWSVIGCPFLSKPQMVRRENPVLEGSTMPGIGLARNPGVIAIWETKSWDWFDDGLGKGGRLVKIGEPDSVTWWREGRPATRAEVLTSIEEGLPILLKVCHCQADQEREINSRFNDVKKYLPT